MRFAIPFVAIIEIQSNSFLGIFSIVIMIQVYKKIAVLYNTYYETGY